MGTQIVALPLGQDREYFIGIFERLLAHGGVREVFVAGRQPGERGTGEGREVVLPYQRLMIVADGTQRFAFSHHGQRQDVTLVQGQAVYAPPHAWTLDFWDREVVMFGLSFRPHALRALVYSHVPDALASSPPEPTPYAYHTATPLAGPGHAVLHALDSLGEDAPESAAISDLLNGVLRLALVHLQADKPHPAAGISRAVRTWRQVIDYLHDHYMEPISRKTVANALGIHPNYLSALARRQAGSGFQAVLEEVRLDNASRLLRETNLPVTRIAGLSGYSSASYFSTAFKRVIGRSPEHCRAAVSGKLASR